jgi:hypothetical protein
MISVMRIRLPFSNPLLKLITGISCGISGSAYQHFSEVATGHCNQHGVCILNRDLKRVVAVSLGCSGVGQIAPIGVMLIDLFNDLRVARPQQVASHWRLITEAVVVPQEPPPSTAILERFTGNIPQGAGAAVGNAQRANHLKATNQLIQRLCLARPPFGVVHQPATHQHFPSVGKKQFSN